MLKEAQERSEDKDKVAKRDLQVNVVLLEKMESLDQVDHQDPLDHQDFQEATEDRLVA